MSISVSYTNFWVNKGLEVMTDVVATIRLTSGCVPLQQAHTSPLPVCPLSDPSGPACGGLTEPRGCPQTRIPECGGTSLSNVHQPPLQIPKPGLGARVAIHDRRARGSLAGKTPERPPDAWLPWQSTSLCLKAGVSAPSTRSSLWENKKKRWVQQYRIDEQFIHEIKILKCKKSLQVFKT